VDNYARLWTARQAAGLEPDDEDDDEALLDPDVLTSSPCFGGLPDTVCGVEPESEEDVEDDESDLDSDDDAATPLLLPRLSVR
jgi:hypothetical protein